MPQLSCSVGNDDTLAVVDKLSTKPLQFCACNGVVWAEGSTLASPTHTLDPNRLGFNVNVELRMHTCQLPSNLVSIGLASP